MKSILAILFILVLQPNTIKAQSTIFLSDNTVITTVEFQTDSSFYYTYGSKVMHVPKSMVIKSDGDILNIKSYENANRQAWELNKSATTLQSLSILSALIGTFAATQLEEPIVPLVFAGVGVLTFTIGIGVENKGNKVGFMASQILISKARD